MNRSGVLAGRASRRRPLVLVALLAMVSPLGTIFSAQAQATSAMSVAKLGTAPASAAATTPTVRLSGEVVQIADQQVAEFAAIRLADGALVPLKADGVKDITSGSAVTLDVAIPADVQVAAAANRTLTTQGVDGRQIAVPLRSSDLAAASDGSPEGLPSAIGKATVAEAMAPGTAALQVSQVVTAAADPVTTYTRTTRNVYVAVVTPAGMTPGAAVDVGRIGTQITGANAYWYEVTAGGVTLRLANTIGARYTSKYDCSNFAGMMQEAAAKVGFTSALPANTSVVVALPKDIYLNPASKCSAGLGTVGGDPNSSGYISVATDAWPALAHELGHNMSLQHANALLCPTVADSAYSTTTSAWTGTGCMEGEYGDGQDVMAGSSTSYAPFLSAPQSLRTGIIPSTAATVVSTVGTRTVTLLPLAGRAGIRTAEVVNPYTGVTYYVEYRTKIGRDLQNVYGVNTGVRVLRYNPNTGKTVLLDPSPTGRSYDPDPTLPVGRMFTSYDGHVRITTVSATSTNALVLITAGPPVIGTPIGHVDTVTGLVGGAASVAGWAIDPDDQRVATDIHVYIDGIPGSGARGINIGPAQLARPDVGSAYPAAGPNHGFNAAITGLTPGVHTFYVYAINAVDTGWNVLLATKTATVPAFGSILPAGGVLSPGDYLTSTDGRYRLTMQGDGNLVEKVTPTGRVLWSSRTAGNGGARLVMQSDGNAVINKVAGGAAWSTRSAGTGSTLVLQTDGNLVNYNSGGRAVWGSSTKNDRLAPGEALTGGQWIRSANGAYTLSMQWDGNLVLHRKAGAAVWSSRTAGRPTAIAASQTDGNFVVRRGSTPLWHTHTGGKRSGGTLVLQSDGNLVLYRGVATWASRRA